MSAQNEFQADDRADTSSFFPSRYQSQSLLHNQPMTQTDLCLNQPGYQITTSINHKHKALGHVSYN